MVARHRQNPQPTVILRKCVPSRSEGPPTKDLCTPRPTFTTSTL
jgi:hypothetical protein